METFIINSKNLDVLKNGLNTFVDDFYQPDNSQLLSHFGEPLLSRSNLQLNLDFNLIVKDARKSSVELQNVKMVYGKLKYLSDSLASDERLWVGLCIGNFWEFTRNRWNIYYKDLEVKDKSESEIKEAIAEYNKQKLNRVRDHFFLRGNTKAGLLRNAIGRLWWIGRLTYNPNGSNEKERWKYTEFVCRNSDFTLQILERSFSSNFNLLKIMVDTLLEAEERGVLIDAELVREVSKYIGILSGAYLIDIMDDDLFGQFIKSIIDKKAQIKINSKNSRESEELKENLLEDNFKEKPIFNSEQRRIKGEPIEILNKHANNDVNSENKKSRVYRCVYTDLCKTSLTQKRMSSGMQNSILSEARRLLSNLENCPKKGSIEINLSNTSKKVRCYFEMGNNRVVYITNILQI